MDSINRQQPEKNREDLRAKEAIDQLREIATQAENCFFCTAVTMGESSGSRPMNIRQVDEQGNLWFLSASDSYKNAEIIADPAVTLYIQGSKHSDFMHLSGHATISRDKAKIKELWTPILSVWFTGGIDDPRITAIKFTPQAGYYWDTKTNRIVAGVKMLIGVALGVTLDDSIEGKLDV